MKLDFSILPKFVEARRLRKLRKSIEKRESGALWNFGKAIAHGDIDTVRQYLELGMDANKNVTAPLPGDPKEYRFVLMPLWIATNWTQPATLEALLAAGADIDGEAMDNAISKLDLADQASIQAIVCMAQHGCDFEGYMGHGTRHLSQIVTDRRKAITQKVQAAHPSVQDGLSWLQAEIRAEDQRQVLERDTPEVGHNIPNRPYSRL